MYSKSEKFYFFLKGGVNMGLFGAEINDSCTGGCRGCEGTCQGTCESGCGSNCGSK